MICTKIKRLKTPLKSRGSFKSPDSTELSLEDFNEQSTISLIKTGSWSEGLQAALIAEINKLYKQIASMKQTSKGDEEFIQELRLNRQQLEMKVKDLRAEVSQLKQIYQLQFFNHQQLRKFYQQRQLQWVTIVTQHRKILQEYDQANGTSLSKLQEKNLNPRYLYTTSQQDQSNLAQNLGQETNVVKQSSKLQKNLIKSRSVQKKDTQVQKLKLRGSNKQNNEANYFKQLSRLYTEQNKFALKSRKSLKSPQNDQFKVKNIHRNLQIDQFFDQIIRKTYYKYKERCISVGEIENMEDMVKLKNANTSTKERLTKTVKKLNFQIANDFQFKLFCQYVEKAVIQRYRTLRGDFVFEFLVEKLKQCEKLALSSDSQLYKLDRQKSNIKDSMIAFGAKKNDKIAGDYAVSNLALSSKNNSVIERVSQKNLELLVHSTIKSVSKSQSRINGSEVSLKSKPSFSSQKDLSELIQTDIFKNTPEEKYFKFGKLKKSQVSQAFLEK